MMAGARRSVGLALLGLGILVPFVPLVLSAVSTGWRYPAIVPATFSTRGLGLVTDPDGEVLPALVTSFTVAAVVAVLASIVGLCGGRAMGLYRFRGKRLVQFLLLAPVLVPGFAVTFGLQVFFIRYGLADTVTGVVLVHLVPTIPYVTLVLGATFASFDIAYEEQARVLGAGPVRTFLSVTLPAVRPGLCVAALFAFLISWSEYVLTLLVGGGTVRTLPLLLFSYIGSADLTEAASVSVVFALPPLVLVVAASRYLTGTQAGVVGLGRL
jgi:putative spermidine/putrescine transport system permease protein